MEEKIKTIVLNSYLNSIQDDKLFNELWFCDNLKQYKIKVTAIVTSGRSGIIKTDGRSWSKAKYYYDVDYDNNIELERKR